jgi:hypothetical protein
LALWKKPCRGLCPLPPRRARVCCTQNMAAAQGLANCDELIAYSHPGAALLASATRARPCHGGCGAGAVCDVVLRRGGRGVRPDLGGSTKAQWGRGRCRPRLQQQQPCPASRRSGTRCVEHRCDRVSDSPGACVQQADKGLIKGWADKGLLLSSGTLVSVC